MESAKAGFMNHPLSLRGRKRSHVVLLLAPLLATGSLAQTKKEESVVSLERFVSEAVRQEDSVIPTIRPISSVLGRAGSVLDAPRAVSTITKAQLEERNVQRIEDLSQFVAGAFTAPIFGNAGVPTLRGDLGEAYQNGQRKAFNRNSFPISFNGVEAVDAVKGAPPALFGFGNATGGYVNFVTKAPFFDRSRTTVRSVVGEWESYRWQVDTGGPLSQKLAYRFSYEGSDAASFYRLVYNDAQSLYGALTYKPSPRLTLDVNAEYVRAHFTENPGVNRPTQALIDSGLYMTGSSVQNGGAGSYFGNTFTPTGTVRIDGSQTLLAPGDGAWSKVLNGQVIARLELDSARSLVNRTYVESVEAEKHSSYYFYSWLPTSLTAENRTEYVADFSTGTLKHAAVAGLSLRYEHRKSYVDILNEVFNAFDLTLNPETLRYPQSQLFFVSPVPGRPYFATPGGRYPRPGRTDSTSLSATLDSEMGTAGLFVQDQIALTDRWSLLAGARLDWVTVDTTDPLPRTGFSPTGDSLHTLLPSGSLSLVFKPAADSTAYVTVNHAAAVEGSSSSGGFGMTNNALREETFENSSVLVEAGGKVALWENRFFAGAALYHQKRNRQNVRFNLPDEIEVSGFELEALYQPTPRLNAGANYTYSHAAYQNGPLPGSIQTTPSFSPSTPSGNFGAYPAGDYRLPGLPLWLFNTYVSYTLPSGFGGSVALNAQGRQNLDLFGAVKIPAQQTWNASLFYVAKDWEVRVDAFNVTDEFNWRATSTPFAGADLVTRELPFRLQGSVKLRF